jgi:hypothetical protein
MPLLEERSGKVDLHGIRVAAGFNADNGVERGERHCGQAARLKSGNVKPLSEDVGGKAEQTNYGHNSHRLLAS